jgi:hypothetical protein
MRAGNVLNSFVAERRQPRRSSRSAQAAGYAVTFWSAFIRRLHARAAKTNPLRGQRALEEIRSRIGTATSRDAVIGLEQGRISRSWQPDARTNRWRPWPNPGSRMFRVVQHEWEETGMHLRYLWAKHPEIASGNVHRV